MITRVTELSELKNSSWVWAVLPHVTDIKVVDSWSFLLIWPAECLHCFSGWSKKVSIQKRDSVRSLWFHWVLYPRLGNNHFILWFDSCHWIQQNPIKECLWFFFEWTAETLGLTQYEWNLIIRCRYSTGGVHLHFYCYGNIEWLKQTWKEKYFIQI